jgi:hypothetical protein
MTFSCKLSSSGRRNGSGSNPASASITTTRISPFSRKANWISETRSNSRSHQLIVSMSSAIAVAALTRPRAAESADLSLKNSTVWSNIGAIFFDRLGGSKA